MSATCEAAREQLVALHLGLKEPVSSDHVAGCADCQALSAELEGALDELRLPEEEPPAGGWDRVALQLDASSRAEPAPKIEVRLTCVYCHDSLLQRRASYCAACLAPHHPDCFEEHGRCSAPGCGGVQVVRPQPVSRPGKRRPAWLAPLVVLGGLGAAAMVSYELGRSSRTGDAVSGYSSSVTQTTAPRVAGSASSFTTSLAPPAPTVAVAPPASPFAPAGPGFVPSAVAAFVPSYAGKSLHEWIDDLWDHDPGYRAKAVKALVSLGPVVVPELERVMTAEEPEPCAAAATVLGRLAAEFDEADHALALGLLLRNADHLEPLVRTEAVRGLGLLGKSLAPEDTEHSRTIWTFVQALDDEVVDVAQAAADGLGHQGPAAAPFLTQMLTLANQTQDDVLRLSLLNAARKIRLATTEQVELVGKILKLGRRSDRFSSAACRALRPRAAEALLNKETIELLLQLARHVSFEGLAVTDGLASEAAKVLHSLRRGPEAELAAPFLVEALLAAGLPGENGHNRANVPMLVRSLRQVGPAGARAVPRLIELAEGTVPGVDWSELLRTLGSIGTPEAQLALVQRLESEVQATREAAVRAFHQYEGLLAPEVVDRMRALLPDERGLEVLNAIAGLYQPLTELTPDIEAVIMDPDRPLDLRVVAVGVFTRSGHPLPVNPASLPFLQKVLEGEQIELELVLAAFDGVTRLVGHEGEGEQPALELLLAQQAHPLPAVRRELARRLGHWTPPGTVGVLETLRDDPDPEVAAEAVRSLESRAD